MKEPAVIFSYRQRVAFLTGIVFLCLLALLFIEPIPQDPAYHLFADTRTFMGIPNFNDVLSNSGFALFGFLGLTVLLSSKRELIFRDSCDARPYLMFFLGVALVSLGSGYYHWEPSNERLLWDRLPMSIVFMAFTSAVIADRVHANSGNGWLLAVLVILGVLSLFHWHHTEQLQRGDLRFYGFVQFFPIILLPFLFWLFPRYHYVSGYYVAWVVAWYGLSKIMEFFDAGIFVLLGHLISGHTLKHLSASVSTFVVLRMLTEQMEQSRDFGKIGD